MCAKDPAVRALEPPWIVEHELLDRALRAGCLKVEGERGDSADAAGVRALQDLGLVCQLYRPPGSRAAPTYVITDGGRIAWRQAEARASRMRRQLAGTIT